MRTTRGYGQFCPVAKAAELLSERWTLLVVRELLAGSRRFGELRRGIPLVSATMLSQRLRELADARVIARGRDGDYQLTAAGRELAPVIDHIGQWGHRWAVSDLRREDVDAPYLMWAVYRLVRAQALGRDPVVIAFELRDAPPTRRRWWLVVDGGNVELCLKDPRRPVDVTLESELLTMARLCLGHVEPRAAIRSGAIALSGDRALVRSFASWAPQRRAA